MICRFHITALSFLYHVASRAAKGLPLGRTIRLRSMRRLTSLLLIPVFAGCFRTVIQQPDGTTATVKTPCDSQIWLMQKKYGKPSQVVLSDKSFWRFRYYYASTRTEYDFGWDSLYGCQVDKQLHLTDDGI